VLEEIPKNNIINSIACLFSLCYDNYRINNKGEEKLIMKKSILIIIAIVAVIAIAILAVTILLLNAKPKTDLEPINTAEDLSALVEKIYEGQDEELIPPSVQTQIIDTTDEEFVQYVTGLESAKDVELVVVSEPMITSQAYSLILVKVKDGVNADEVAKTMSENVDTRKWICVTAEKLYATSSGDVVCLVMTKAETAKVIYERFKTLAGTVSEEYERTEEEAELPPEMY